MADLKNVPASGKGSRRSSQREDRRSRAKRKKNRRNLIISLAVGSVALILIASLFIPQLTPLGTENIQPIEDADSSSNPLAGEKMPSLGRTHVEEGTSISYNSVPPTSGSHYDTAADWGIYDTQIPDGTTVHNLEHGGINVSHNLVDPVSVEALKDFIRNQVGFPGCFIVQPYASLPSGSVALTAWEWIEVFQGVDLPGMQMFIDDHVNRGPEFFGPNCGEVLTMPTSPTPES